MQKLFFLLSIFLSAATLGAQLKAPVASPRANLSQNIGLVNITVDYSRPSKKGRTIFGSLVPYNKIWRTGANQATTFSVSDDIKINNQLVPKGEYHIYSVPREKRLDLIVYKKTDKWGSLKEFDESLIVARVVSDFIELPFSVETFEISFDNISNNGSTLNLIWDNMLAIYYIDALTKDKMVNNIKNTLSENPKPSDYQKAALYYYEEGLDKEKAYEWINLAFESYKEPKYWQLRVKALVYNYYGKKREALKIAKLGLKQAKKSDAPDGLNTLSLLVDRLSK
ncbi:MAG: hypothetical protein CM15mP101_07740 [Flavobacteriaceae bacterium]|nr:MAG: hypothetical protein CM15mP101_07740 [Flavobacteriaceae bacterium]